MLKKSLVKVQEGVCTPSAPWAACACSCSHPWSLWLIAPCRFSQAHREGGGRTGLPGVSSPEHRKNSPILFAHSHKSYFCFQGNPALCSPYEVTKHFQTKTVAQSRPFMPVTNATYPTGERQARSQICQQLPATYPRRCTRSPEMHWKGITIRLSSLRKWG